MSVLVVLAAAQEIILILVVTQPMQVTVVVLEVLLDTAALIQAVPAVHQVLVTAVAVQVEIQVLL
jgi:hypothetical protein